MIHLPAVLIRREVAQDENVGMSNNVYKRKSSQEQREGARVNSSLDTFASICLPLYSSLSR
jgi:hypothetical protein